MITYTRCHGCGSISLPLNAHDLCRYCTEFYKGILRKRAQLKDTLRRQFAWRRLQS